MQFQNFLFFSLLIAVPYSSCISLHKSSKLSDINSQLHLLQERNLELSRQIEENTKLAKQLTNELHAVLDSNNNNNNNNTSYSNITIQFFDSTNKHNAVTNTPPLTDQQRSQTQTNTIHNAHANSKPTKHRHKRAKRLIDHKPSTKESTNIHNDLSSNVSVKNESDKVFKKITVVKTPQMLQSERMLEFNTPFHHDNHSADFKDRIEAMSHKVDSLIKKRDDLLMKAFTRTAGKYAVDYPENINKTYIAIDDLLKTFLKQKRSISAYAK